MVSLNRATLIGNVGRDPEIRHTQGGQIMATLSVATNEKWRDKRTGENKEATEWHRVVIWNPALVKVVEQYVTKGKQIFIEGKLTTRKWQDQAGQDKYTTEIVVGQYGGQVILLGSGGGGNTDAPAPAGRQVSLAEELDDEIPF